MRGALGIREAGVSEGATGRRADKVVDAVAFCMIGIACVTGIVWARHVPFIVAMVVFGLSIESWYVYRFVRGRMRRSSGPSAGSSRESRPSED
jgi:hypothetical protein